MAGGDEATREALGSIGIQPKREGAHQALHVHPDAPALPKLAGLSADGSRVALLDCEGDRFVLRARGTSTSQAVDVTLPGSAGATRLHTVTLSPCGTFACVHGAHHAFFVSLAPSLPHRVHAVEHDLRPNEVWVRARWHPLARGTLVLGTRYGHLLAFARAGTGLERRLSLHAAGSRATSFDSRNLADFAFGSAPGWDQLTAYLAFDDGPVAAVCPFAPRGCVLDAASMANLRAEATAVAAGAAEGAVKGVRSVRAKCKATRRDAQAVRAWLAQAWHREAGAGGREHWVFAPPREGSGLLTPRDFGPGQCVPVRMQPMRPLPQWHDYSGSDAPPTSVCAARSELGGAAPVVGLEASAAPVAGAQQQQQQQRDEGSSSPYAAGEGGDTHAIPAWPVLALLHADGVLVAAVVTRPPLPRWRANSQERLAGVADHELEPPAASLRGEFGDVRYDDTDDWVSGARRVCGVDRGAAAWWQELHKGGARAESVAADLGIVLCRGEGGEPYPRAGQSRAPWLTQDPEDPQLLLCSHVGGLSVVTLGDTERWCTEVVEEAEAEGGEEEAGPPVPPARVEVVPIIAPGLSAPRGASLARRTGPAAADSGHTLLVATRRGAIRCVSPWGALLRGHRASRVRAIDSAVQQAQRQGPDTVASTADGVEELTGDARSAADALALHKCDHTAFKAAVTELIGRLEAAKAAGTLKRGLAGRRGKEVADGDAAIGSEDEEEEGEEEEGEKDGEAATTALIKRFAGQVEGMSRRRVITLARLGDTLEARREMLRSRQEDIVRQVQRLREVARGGGGGELCTLQEEARQLNREMRRRAQAADGFLNVLRQMALPLSAEERKFERSVQSMQRTKATKLRTMVQRIAQQHQRLQRLPSAPLDDADLRRLRACLQTAESKVDEAQLAEEQLRHTLERMRAYVASAGAQ